jgi:hypothetical protein
MCSACLVVVEGVVLVVKHLGMVVLALVVVVEMHLGLLVHLGPILGFMLLIPLHQMQVPQLVEL